MTGAEAVTLDHGVGGGDSGGAGAAGRVGLPTAAAFAALMRAGFRRYATYRQATYAGAFTNTVFGFLKGYVLVAVATGAGGLAAGYDVPQLLTFAWVGQGLLAIVMMWPGPQDLAERVRSGDVTADLLRPVDPIWTYGATDLGRAGHGALVRFLVPVTVGALAFDLYAPQRLATYPLFVVSVLLATIVSFGLRHLVNLTAFWLLDLRGVSMVYLFVMSLASGFYFPLAFLPDWLETAMWFATPFPSLFQGPLDIVVERGSAADQVGILAIQLAWATVALVACHLVQRRAVRKLVVQGG